MSQAEFRNPFSGGNNPTQNQLQSYMKCGIELKNYVVNEDQATVSVESSKLKKYVQNLQKILQTSRKSQQFVNQRLQKLKTQALAIQNKINQFDTCYRNTNKQSEYLTKILDQENIYRQNCKKRIQLANQINYKQFLKLQIEDRKDVAHWVFKWILTVIYKQPENKYYLENFQEQGIEIDGGEDLKERLGKISALNGNQEQLVNTQKFIDMFSAIQKSEHFGDLQSQINNIYEIAKLFLASIQNGRNIKQFKKLIQESRHNNQKGIQQNQYDINDLKTLSSRIKIGEHYLSQIKNIRNIATSKLTKYLKQMKLSEDYNRNDAQCTIF